MSRPFMHHGQAMAGRVGRIIPFVLSLGFVLSSPRAVQAQTWNGTVSNLWSNSSNWTPNTVPNASTANVTITSATTNPVQVDISPTIGNLTLGASNTLNVMDNNSLYVTGTTIDNSGQINIGSSNQGAALYVDGSANTLLALTGSGAVTLNNTDSYLWASSASNNVLSNQSTINGQGYIDNLSLANGGTVNANVPVGWLTIENSSVLNLGTLQATGGGTLQIYASTLDTGGTISTDSASTVIINDSTVLGATFTSSGSAVIQSINDNTLNGVTITAGSTFVIDGANTNTLLGNLTINGTFLIGQSGTSGGSTLEIDSAQTGRLFGTGTLTLNNPDSYLEGYLLTTSTLVNQTTINGQGYIYRLDLDNQGTIDANVSGGTLSIYDTTTTNSGVFKVEAGATLDLTHSTLTNFESSGSAGTLTGGTYEIFSGTLSFYNGGFTSDIVTNAATILLDGAAGTPRFLDQDGNNALANLAINTGNLTIQNGVNLTASPFTSLGFSNYGTLTIGANSAFTVGASNDYIQYSGTTTLGASSSVLAVADGHSVVLNAGTIQGFGTIQGNLSNSGGVVLPGEMGTAGVLTVTGNYSEDSGPSVSHLFIQIGGPDALHGLAQLDVGGTATLSGLLDLSLVGGFTPYNGELFEILTSNGLSGTFLDSTISVGDIRFTVEYGPAGYANDVVLVANVSSLPEPSSWLLLGFGVAGAGAFAVRRSGKGRTRAAQ
jgi:hypothetical protein